MKNSRNRLVPFGVVGGRGSSARSARGHGVLEDAAAPSTVRSRPMRGHAARFPFINAVPADDLGAAPFLEVC